MSLIDCSHKMTRFLLDALFIIWLRNDQAHYFYSFYIILKVHLTSKSNFSVKSR